MQPRVVDISHHNTVTDLRETANAGIWGVIHKATQGIGYRDPDYTKRRELCRQAGLLWGAYHFNDGSDVTAQVNNFITYAKPDADTLMVLDFEDNPRSNMTMQNAVKFLQLMEQRGYKCALYSGNRVKEHIGELSQEDRDYLTAHLLWLCQYGPRPVMPKGWKAYFLWQYTGDGVGPTPHNVPGIVSGNKGLDLNVFDGTQIELKEMWSSTVRKSVHTDIAGSDAGSTHSMQPIADKPPTTKAVTILASTAAGGAVGATGSSWSEYYTVAREYLLQIPPEAWLLTVILVACGVWFMAKRTA